MSQTDHFTAKIAFTAKSLKFYASKNPKPSRLDKSTGQDRRSAHLPVIKCKETKLLRSGANMMRREFYRIVS